MGLCVDELEFDSLYQREWSLLVGQVFLVCGDLTEAQDCVQEAFVKAWEHRSELRSDAGGWLRTTALRVSVSRWRKTRNALTAWSRHSGGPEVMALDPSHLDNFDGEIWDALRALPVRQREAVVLHHVLDMSVADAAELLLVSPEAFRVRLSRGRNALRNQLQDPALAPTSAFSALQTLPTLVSLFLLSGGIS